MGLTSSCPEKQLSPEQQDVKYLGERMPFGDEELVHVYRAYQAMMKAQERISFLTDIGVYCVKDASEERMILLQAVEHKLLTPALGNRLYETAFLPPKAPSEYSSPTSSIVEDAYTQRVKLEAFFDGLSNCSRRGNQKSLKVLFDCCQPHSSSTTTEVLVDPVELVTIGYRVGLASGFLSAAQSAEEDVSRFFLDNDGDENTTTNDAGLAALAESLKEYAAKRKQRLNNSTPPEPIPFVSEADVQEWAEQVAPMFGSALATLTHMLFFPGWPYPPTRTSFDYPNLAEFTSTFVSKGSSSLLFSFGCMSPSLGGEVSAWRLSNRWCRSMILQKRVLVLSLVHFRFGWTFV